jgi:hypothetical protein
VEQVALLQDAHHGARLLVALDLADRLVAVRVELLALGTIAVMANFSNTASSWRR